MKSTNHSEVLITLERLERKSQLQSQQKRFFREVPEELKIGKNSFYKLTGR